MMHVSEKMLHAYLLRERSKLHGDKLPPLNLSDFGEELGRNFRAGSIVDTNGGYRIKVDSKGNLHFEDTHKIDVHLSQPTQPMKECYVTGTGVAVRLKKGGGYIGDNIAPKFDSVNDMNDFLGRVYDAETGELIPWTTHRHAPYGRVYINSQGRLLKGLDSRFLLSVKNSSYSMLTEKVSVWGTASINDIRDFAGNCGVLVTPYAEKKIKEAFGCVPDFLQEYYEETETIPEDKTAGSGYWEYMDLAIMEYGIKEYEQIPGFIRKIFNSLQKTIDENISEIVNRTARKLNAGGLRLGNGFLAKPLEERIEILEKKGYMKSREECSVNFFIADFALRMLAHYAYKHGCEDILDDELDFKLNRHVKVADVRIAGALSYQILRFIMSGENPVDLFPITKKR